MKEHPILFSAPMVRALLANRKFVTRRLDARWMKVKAGDQLWVRESGWLDRDERRFFAYMATPGIAIEHTYREFIKTDPATVTKESMKLYYKSVPSIHMPRWASRIQLEALEDTRAERLQDITEEEARLEGVTLTPCPHPEAFHSTRCPNESYRVAFAILWGQLHTKPGERWEDNPTVYRVGRFRRIA